MEYILLTLLIMVIIVVLIFFLSTWQITQLQVEQSRTRMSQALALTKQVSNSPYFVKSDSLFDDAKLTALITRTDPCRDLDPILGSGWFIEITVTGSAVDTWNDRDCITGLYPECGYWMLNCSGGAERFDAFTIPINIYRNKGFVSDGSVFSRNDIGTLTVGVYYD